MKGEHQGLPPGPQSRHPTFNPSQLPLSPTACDYSLLNVSIWSSA